MAEHRYRAYVAAFNSADLDAVGTFLAEDMVFDWGTAMPAFDGRAAFLAFYRTAWSYFREQLTVSDIRIDGARLTAWIENDITPFRDWRECPFGALHAGQPLHVNGRMAYQYDGVGLIAHIVEVG